MEQSEESYRDKYLNAILNIACNLLKHNYYDCGLTLYVDYPWNIEIAESWVPEEDDSDFGITQSEMRQLTANSRKHFVSVIRPLSIYRTLYPAGMSRMETAKCRKDRLRKDFQIIYQFNTITNEQLYSGLIRGRFDAAERKVSTQEQVISWLFQGNLVEELYETDSVSSDGDREPNPADTEHDREETFPPGYFSDDFASEAEEEEEVQATKASTCANVVLPAPLNSSPDVLYMGVFVQGKRKFDSYVDGDKFK